MTTLPAKIRLTFRRALSGLGWPTWLVREQVPQPDGSVVECERRDMYVITLLFDMMAERVRLGIEARYPGLGAADARAQQGKDRNVLRGPSESDASYDARLIRAVDDQRAKGSPDALLNQVAGYLSPFPCVLRTVDNSGNWVTRNADGSITRNYFQNNWNWDGLASNAGYFGRYSLIIYPSSTGWASKSTVLGAGGRKLGAATNTIATTLTHDQVESLKRLCIEWRPDGVMPQWIIIAFDDTSFVPTTPPGAPLPAGTWGPWGQPASGSPVTASRLATARYIEVDPNLSISH